MDATLARAVLAAAQTQDSVHTGPGFLRWVLLACLIGVAVLAFVLLRGYKR